ncbi:hypothetical protein BGZ83_007712 [Gryganskiella cystojenkinii]|nr:hypothetical protein BGZ83_007712 [Gryganskiella cystojenkinii]
MSAHSSSWPTITRSEHIVDLRHDVLPRNTAAAAALPFSKRSSFLDLAEDTVSKHDTVRLAFSAFNTTFHLYLEPNHDLIHPEATLGDDVDFDDIKAFRGVVIQDSFHADRKWNWALTTSRMEKRTIEHMLHEEGVLGWARMMIEQDDDDSATGRTLTIPASGFGEGLDLSSSWSDMLKSSMLSKRQVAVKVAGPNPVPEGCPANRLVNYMGVAADCTYVRNYGGAALARKQIFADFNTASGIYESTFNVALGVIALNITTDNCPTTPVKGEEWNQDCSGTYTIDQRLSDFSFWRGQDGRSNDGAGLWHLMTKCNSGAVVGIAWTKTLCQMKTNAQGQGSSLQYTAGTGVSSVTPNEWMVVAHEIGHGFGAIHDCTTQYCPNPSGQCCPLSTTTCDAGAQFIMNPSETTATKVFSPCSIKAICGTIQSSSGQCLQPPGTRSTQSSETNICGNGLKEAGEDCDCGSADDCAKDPCCDGTTCKFKGGAVCDDTNDDCCQNCQLRPAGQVCRQAISECDVQEVCSGTNATCPPDVRIANETPCKGNGNMTGLQCANGVCTSRDLQCQQQDRQGITKACGASNSCDLLCNDPSSSLSCMQVPGTYFMDGTSCGFGGTCTRGSCEYSSGIQGVLNWARNHLSIVIPVGCLIGLILLCCIWSCCCSRWFDNRRQRKMMVPKPPGLVNTGGSFTHGGARSMSNRTGPQPPTYGVDTVQGARHGEQSYPLQSLSPPPPVYYDPTVMSAHTREEQDLQKALEESRLEHERDQQRRSSSFRHSHATSVESNGPASPPGTFSSRQQQLSQQQRQPSPVQAPRNGTGVTFTPLLPATGGPGSPDYSSRRENNYSQSSNNSRDRDGGSQGSPNGTRKGGYSPSGRY